MLLEGEFAIALVCAAQVTAHERGPDDMGYLEHLEQLLASRAVFLDEPRGSRADRAESDLYLEVEAVGMLPNAFEVIGIRAPEKARFGEIHDCRPVRVGEIHQLERAPALRPQAE